MRTPNKRFRLMQWLPRSAGLAIVVLAAVATAVQAQQRGRTDGPSMAPRAPMTSSGSPIGGFGSQIDPFGNGPNDLLDSRVIGRGKSRPGRGVSSGEAAPGEDGPRSPLGRRPPARRAGINIPPGNEQRFVKDEVVLEFAGNFSPQGIARLLARHRLTQLEAQNFTLTNSILVRARIGNRRSVRAVLRGLRNERVLRAGQPNYLYRGSQQAEPGPAATIAGPADATPKATPVAAAAGALPAAGDPAQYALSKLRLNEAHRFATGNRVLIAVIDSAIDAGHPELQGVIAGSYDALGTAEKPHLHGTAIAGAIAARARLMGAAPSARILAIRAFGSAGGGVEATTFAILKGIEYAAAHKARVINMSFAGPADPGLARQLAAAKARGAVLVAAAGNLGPNSPPQYPAADPNVIAVSATDADDKLFKASNIGRHIAVAAPGVDILLPAPGNDYQLSSGTSFAAAHVSGIAALILERAPDLAPDAVRRILQSTAKDLGPRGKDAQFGAGLADAYRAITAVERDTATAPLPPPRPARAR